MRSSALACPDNKLRRSGIPLTWFGLKHSTWSKEELGNVVRTLGGKRNVKSSKPDLFKQLHRLRPHSTMTRRDQRNIRQVRLDVAQRKAGARLQLFRLQNGLRPSSRMTEGEEVKVRQRRVQIAIQKPNPDVMREAKATVNSIADSKGDSETQVSKALPQMPQSWYDDMFRNLNSQIEMSSRDCEVCYERIRDDQLIWRTITSSCNHRSVAPICRHCLQQNMSA